MTTENKKTAETGENKTLEQVKQEVLSMVDSGVNYREIAKIPFNISGSIRRFPISAISRWKKERDEAASQTDQASLAAKAFSLFEQGKGPIDAVVELNLEPGVAEELYDKWKKMKEQDLSTPSVPRRLKELEEKMSNGLVESLVQELHEPLLEGEDSPSIEELFTFFYSIGDILETVRRVKFLPIFNLYDNFACKTCGSQHRMGLNVRCSKCGTETWWGY